MTKTQLIDKIAQECGQTKKATAEFTDAFFDVLAGVLADGESVQISGFGSFNVKQVAARTGRNPKTNEAVEIPASRRVTFSAGKALKTKVNG